MTQKAVGNAILQSGIANDSQGWSGTSLLQPIAKLTERIPSDALNLNKNAQWEEFVCNIDPRLGMVVMRWKDSKVCQTISTVIKKGQAKFQQQT
eukprot:15340664-Ditylum_brightwellii.AAC.1